MTQSQVRSPLKPKSLKPFFQKNGIPIGSGDKRKKRHPSLDNMPRSVPRCLNLPFGEGLGKLSGDRTMAHLTAIEARDSHHTLQTTC